MIFLSPKGIKGDLPTYEYSLFDDDKEVGFLQLRQRPSAGVGLPSFMGSHVYYEVSPEYQKKGYGKALLSLCKEEAKRKGINPLLLSVWESNLPSRKIIENNGGKLSKEWFSEEKGEKFLLFELTM